MTRLSISVALGMSLVHLVACGDDSAQEAPSSGGAGGTGDVGGSSATSGGGGMGAQGGTGGTGAACDNNVIEMELTIADGIADSQVLPIRYEGQDAYLAIDTGSPLTFLYGDEDGPEYVDHVGDIQIGCETLGIDSLKLDAIGPEPFNGKMIIGLVGMDFFSAVPTEIDYPGRKVVRYLTDPLPIEGLSEVEVDWNGVRILTTVSLDEEELVMIYDAGSPHTLLTGTEGQPGDEELQLGTADGAFVTVYFGTGTLGFAKEVTYIPVWRTESFPYIQEELDELGAAGLLGASGMGFRRIGFDLAQDRMWLGPRVSP